MAFHVLFISVNCYHLLVKIVVSCLFHDLDFKIVLLLDWLLAKVDSRVGHVYLTYGWSGGNDHNRLGWDLNLAMETIILLGCINKIYIVVDLLGTNEVASKWHALDLFCVYEFFLFFSPPPTIGQR